MISESDENKIPEFPFIPKNESLHESVTNTASTASAREGNQKHDDYKNLKRVNVEKLGTNMRKHNSEYISSKTINTENVLDRKKSGPTNPCQTEKNLEKNPADTLKLKQKKQEIVRRQDADEINDIESSSSETEVKRELNSSSGDSSDDENTRKKGNFVRHSSLSPKLLKAKKTKRQRSTKKLDSAKELKNLESNEDDSDASSVRNNKKKQGNMKISKESIKPKDKQAKRDKKKEKDVSKSDNSARKLKETQQKEERNQKSSGSEDDGNEKEVMLYSQRPRRAKTRTKTSNYQLHTHESSSESDVDIKTNPTEKCSENGNDTVSKTGIKQSTIYSVKTHTKRFKLSLNKLTEKEVLTLKLDYCKIKLLQILHKFEEIEKNYCVEITQDVATKEKSSISIKGNARHITEVKHTVDECSKELTTSTLELKVSPISKVLLMFEDVQDKINEELQAKRYSAFFSAFNNAFYVSYKNDQDFANICEFIKSQTEFKHIELDPEMLGILQSQKGEEFLEELRKKGAKYTTSLIVVDVRKHSLLLATRKEHMKRLVSSVEEFLNKNKIHMIEIQMHNKKTFIDKFCRKELEEILTNLRNSGIYVKESSEKIILRGWLQQLKDGEQKIKNLRDSLATKDTELKYFGIYTLLSRHDAKLIKKIQDSYECIILMKTNLENESNSNLHGMNTSVGSTISQTVSTQLGNSSITFLQGCPIDVKADAIICFTDDSGNSLDGIENSIVQRGRNQLKNDIKGRSNGSKIIIQNTTESYKIAGKLFHIVLTPEMERDDLVNQIVECLKQATKHAQSVVFATTAITNKVIYNEKFVLQSCDVMKAIQQYITEDEHTMPEIYFCGENKYSVNELAEMYKATFKTGLKIDGENCTKEDRCIELTVISNEESKVTRAITKLEKICKQKYFYLDFPFKEMNNKMQVLKDTGLKYNVSVTVKPCEGKIVFEGFPDDKDEAWKSIVRNLVTEIDNRQRSDDKADDIARKAIRKMNVTEEDSVEQKDGIILCEENCGVNVMNGSSSENSDISDVPSEKESTDDERDRTLLTNMNTLYVERGKNVSEQLNIIAQSDERCYVNILNESSSENSDLNDEQKANDSNTNERSSPNMRDVKKAQNIAKHNNKIDLTDGSLNVNVRNESSSGNSDINDEPTAKISSNDENISQLRQNTNEQHTKDNIKEKSRKKRKRKSKRTLDLKINKPAITNDHYSDLELNKMKLSMINLPSGKIIISNEKTKRILSHIKGSSSDQATFIMEEQKIIITSKDEKLLTHIKGELLSKLDDKDLLLSEDLVSHKKLCLRKCKYELENKYLVYLSWTKNSLEISLDSIDDDILLNRDVTNVIMLYSMQSYNMKIDTLSVWPKTFKNSIIIKAKEFSVVVHCSSTEENISLSLEGCTQNVDAVKMFAINEIHEIAKTFSRKSVIGKETLSNNTLAFSKSTSKIVKGYCKNVCDKHEEMVSNKKTKTFVILVDAKTVKAVTDLIQKTWEPALVGIGADAKCLVPNTVIEVLDVQRVGNIHLFDPYANERKKFF